MVRKLSIRALPEGSAEINVLQIGDIHLAPWQKRKMAFLKKIAELPIDLVVNTGDNLGHKNSVPSLIEALTPLMKKPGVFVHGSNDYSAPVAKNPIGYVFHTSEAPNSEALDTASMTKAFEESGWKNLNNRSANLVVNGNKIGFIGVDDHHIGRSDLSALKEDSSFTIALTHAPYLQILEGLSDLGASFIFAGHTHGGQVRVPIFGALTTNSDLPNKYARGTSAWEFSGRNVILSVVAGLGNSIFAPVRFFCLPEVRLITLLPKN